MTTPSPFSTMAGVSLLMRRMGDSMFTLITFSHSSGLPAHEEICNDYEYDTTERYYIRNKQILHVLER